MKRNFTNRLFWLMAFMSVACSAFAAKTYKSTANAYASPSGAGSVYVKYNSAASTSDKATANHSQETKNDPSKDTYHFLANTTNNAYYFVGWYTNANGGGTQKSTSESYSESITPTESGASLDRYAYWKEKTAPTVTAPTAVANLKYTGSAQALITAGSVSGGTLQYSSDGTNFNTTVPTATKAGDYTVYYKVVGDAKHLDVAATQVSATIGKAALTVTAENKQTTYGIEAPAFTAAIAGFVGEETEVVLSGELAFDCEYAVGSNAGEYAITPSGLTASNYDITFNAGKLTVDKANPTITTEPAATAELVYNGEDQALISAGEVENGTFQYSLDNAAFAAELPTGKDAKTYDVYYKVVGNDNYNDIEFATPIEAAIAKADVTLTAPVAYDTLAYNGLDQELIIVGEAAGGEMQYSLDGETYATTIPTAKEIGEYTVYYKVVGDANHNDVAAATVAVSIAKPRAELTTAPVAIDELVYDGNAHTLITAGEAAGGELQYSLDGENYATILPEGTNAQTYTVYYKVVGDENHSDLVCNPLEVTIAKVALTIAAENKETTYGVEAPAFTVTYQGFIGEETEAVLDGELAFDCEYAVGSNAGEYVITPKGQTAQNYNITFNEGKLTVAKAALSVTAEDKETTYGAEAPAFTVAYEGFYGEETEAVLEGEIAFACEYAVGSNAGEYTITPSGLEAVNYEITFNEGKLTVAKAALSVTAVDKETTYGAEAPAFTVAYEGFIGEETEAVLDGEIAFACEYTVGNNAGEYTITPSGLTAGNYEITFNEGKLTVAKAALSVTADNKETTYGAEAPAFTVAYEGFIGEETEAVLTGELAFACEYAAGSNAGEYTITPSGLTADNYDITFNNGTLTVAKVDVEIVVAPAAKAGLVYTGEPQELITAGEVTGGELQYSLKANKDFSTDIPTRTETGFYQVYYRVVADANHNDVAATMIMTRIAGAKASLTVEPVAAENLVYTGEAQALLATAGEAEGGELQYSLDGENYTAAEPVATNAGDYTVYYKVVGDGTHSDLEPATLNVSIAKADAAVAAAPEAIENLVANGDDHELVTAGEAIGGTIVYSLDGENFSAELPVASEEGDYTVTYKVQGDENHNDSEAAELTVTIAEQGTATAVDNSRSQVTVKKVIRDNQVLIIREGRTYNASGLLVK